MRPKPTLDKQTIRFGQGPTYVAIHVRVKYFKTLYLYQTLIFCSLIIDLFNTRSGTIKDIVSGCFKTMKSIRFRLYSIFNLFFKILSQSSFMQS